MINRLIISFGKTPFFTIDLFKAWHKLHLFLRDKRNKKRQRRHKNNRH
ncbi:hypothetical protein [Ligilactobacillus salivarius]|nr:hypothetical protein [Ligilactobacillus salivarius]MBE5068029.1 hypothetical protein [Ligilactobacillus salivarius]